MGSNAISSGPNKPYDSTPAATPSSAPLGLPPVKTDEKPWGIDVSPSLTFSGGRYGGTDVGMVGARIEFGKEIASAKYARAEVIGDVHAAMGNGMMTGGGIGVRGELGTKTLNIYGAAGPEVNHGYTECGATGGLSLRAAAGIQAGKFYGEVAQDVGTNIRMTTASVGMRFRF